MKNRTTLTKSLTTVTVVARLAMHLQEQQAKPAGDLAACRAALKLIGQEADFSRDDEVIKDCVKKMARMRRKQEGAQA